MMASDCGKPTWLPISYLPPRDKDIDVLLYSGKVVRSVRWCVETRGWIRFDTQRPGFLEVWIEELHVQWWMPSSSDNR